MYLQRVQLTEFRSYHFLDLQIPAPGLTLVGPNAAGKSSLLEAVRMLSTMRSPRTPHDRDVINWDSGADLGVAPFARLVGEAVTADEALQVELGLQLADAPGGPLRKQVRINQHPRRVLDSVGALKSVLFTPEDLDLVGGSPSQRRRFIDLLIGQVDRAYVSELSAYVKVIEQRNSLLRSFARGSVTRSSAIEQLLFWDEQLVDHGAFVSAARRVVVGRLCAQFRARAGEFATSADLTARYAPNLGSDFLLSARMDDPKDRVRAVARREFETQIKIRRDNELRRGVTLIGPHRDELEILIGERPLASFGSRGQQRLAVVALKLAEADVIAELGERPILLLDDVLSELDRSHRQTLLERVRSIGAQVLLTTADAAQVAETAVADLTVAAVEPGAIRPENSL